MATQYLLEIDHTTYGKLRFKDPDQISEWLASEREFWNWGPRSPQDLGFLDLARRDHLRSRINKAEGQLNLYRNNPNADAPLNNLRNLIVEYLNLDLWSKSPRAKFISSLRDVIPDGMVMAQSALSTFLGDTLAPVSQQQPQQFRYASLRGKMAMVAFDAGMKPDAIDQVSAGVRAITSENTKAVDAMIGAYTAKIDELDGINRTTREESDSIIAALRNSTSAEIEKMLAAKEEAVSSCAAAKAFYTTDMEIRAPINYWLDERDAHKWGARIWGALLLLYTAAGSYALVYTLSKAFDYAASNTNDRLSHTDFLVTAAVAVVITILFWIARFLSRLYLSERHMRIDAASRVTMAKTFLALAANKNVDEKDRGLVLAPLFRPGTDGIIKEDTGVDSVLGMVARALERPAK